MMTGLIQSMWFYRNGAGEWRGPMMETYDKGPFKWKCGATDARFTVKGQFYEGLAGAKSDLDLSTGQIQPPPRDPAPKPPQADTVQEGWIYENGHGHTRGPMVAIDGRDYKWWCSVSACSFTDKGQYSIREPSKLADLNMSTGRPADVPDQPHPTNNPPSPRHPPDVAALINMLPRPEEYAGWQLRSEWFAALDAVVTAQTQIDALRNDVGRFDVVWPDYGPRGRAND